MYVDVYRSDDEEIYSEYDIMKNSQTSLVYRQMPIHMTPFTPEVVRDSRRDGQTTSIVANIRSNYSLKRDDTLVHVSGRRFNVDSIESTQGAFMGNSIILKLTEEDAEPR